MQKLMLAIIFVSLGASSASAQSSDSYHYVQFYGGYTIDKSKSDTRIINSSRLTFDSSASVCADILGINFLELVL